MISSVPRSIELGFRREWDSFTGVLALIGTSLLLALASNPYGVGGKQSEQRKRKERDSRQFFSIVPVTSGGAGAKMGDLAPSSNDEALSECGCHEVPSPYY